MKAPRSALRTPRSLIRPLVRRLHGYVPGEQPKIKDLIKLNTNENPYPPSPKVLAAIKEAIDGRLRLYPNPTAQLLREDLARFHGCEASNIIVGNGSDELLAIATRAFVEPDRSVLARSEAREETFALKAVARARSTVQFFTPSYSLYPVLAEIHGARTNAVPLARNFALPTIQQLRREKIWDFHAALSFITTPNAPSGRGYSTTELAALCESHRGVIILDEAYVDFASENALKLGLKHPHVLIARTFSKAYSLCFQRVGYFIGYPELIAALDKVRDSYNVNGLGQIAAQATLDALAYYKGNFRKIIATRERLSLELTQLGFDVFPSQTNFMLMRPPRFAAREWLDRLRSEKILVRWFNTPEVVDFLRVTVGTDVEADAMLKATKRILRGPSQ